MKTLIKVVLIVLLLAVCVGGAALYMKKNGGASDEGFRTAPVKRGDVVSTISATGTVEPEEVVDVGAQVAGQILAFGKDKNGKTVDYGSEVEADTILAQIDDTVYGTDVAQAQSQVEGGKASVARAQADLEQMKAKLRQAERDWARAEKLGPNGAISQTDFDLAKSAYEIAQANIGVGEATIAQAVQSIHQAEAGLQRAQRNLGFTTIKSPVKGVIIDRRVNIGQTVVASLNAPSLFLLAKDLTRMQVWVSVNEADIGHIHAGQPVSFTVDAYPGQSFHGSVGKVRLNAAMTQNVVTYTVEVVTENPDRKLLPYLTANVQFEVARHEGVLTVPNAALRWQPQTEQISPDVRDKQQAAATTGPADGAPRRARGATTKRASVASSEMEGRTGAIWVIDGPFVKPIRVRAGISDGLDTEVRGEGISEGMEVVIGEQRAGTASAGAASGASSNPFAPQFGGTRRGGR